MLYPAYRRLVIGQAVSSAGTFVTVVALSYQVNQLAKSSFAVGMVHLADARA